MILCFAGKQHPFVTHTQRLRFKEDGFHSEFALCLFYDGLLSASIITASILIQQRGCKIKPIFVGIQPDVTRLRGTVVEGYGNA